MSTVKITDLPKISTINANTANTVLVGVDIPTNITGQMTLTTLAAGLYSNNNLTVGENYTILPNVVGQFTGNSTSYIQINLQNLESDGSADYVITADIGDDTNYYVDLGLNGSNYNYAGYTFANKLDGYLVVQGSNTAPASPGGNLVIGTTTVGKDITFTQGAFDTSGQVAKFIYNTGFKLLKKPLIFADGTQQNTAVLYSDVDARVTANAASANSVINSRISSNVATVTTFTQAAFDKANNALANETGTFTGDLTITGDTNILKTLHVHNTALPGNTQFIVVTNTVGETISAPSNPGYTFHSAIEGNGNRVVSESYGANTDNYTAFIGRRARGTASAPTAVQNGDIILRVGGNGYGATKFSQFSDARIEFVATQTHTDTSKGTQIQFWTTPSGSNTAAQIGTMNGDAVSFTGVVSPQKGFIYTPRILTGAQTAITIDFATDSMVRAEFNSTLTMSFTNYTYGKVVEAWLTNTAGNGQTINMGVLANNSTTGSASLSVASGRSAKLQYFSIDGDLSNTFVAVTYA
jgi:hypothetical protein